MLLMTFYTSFERLKRLPAMQDYCNTELKIHCHRFTKAYLQCKYVTDKQKEVDIRLSNITVPKHKTIVKICLTSDFPAQTYKKVLTRSTTYPGS